MLPDVPRAAPVDSAMSRFVAEGQDPAMVAKLLDRVREICTSQEDVLYMAVQQRPIANFLPDAVVLTNRRFIVFRQKVLGQMNFIDCAWLHAADVHMKENLLGATISLRGVNGHVETMDYLPKAQARKVYRIAQEMEEEVRELRRHRQMEESRAGANQVIVQTAVTPPATSSAAPASDPLAKLQQLKAMLDAGLITQAEYDAKKTELLAQM